MPQDRETGSQARDWGYKMAGLVAEHLGAVLVNPRKGNEATLRGVRVVIKSARPRTTGIGVTELTLARVDAVVVALGQRDGAYRIYRIPVSWYRDRMNHDVRPHQNVYHVSRRAIEKEFSAIASFAVP